MSKNCANSGRWSRVGRASRRAVALSAALALTLAACGSDDDTGSTGGSTKPPASADSVSPDDPSTTSATSGDEPVEGGTLTYISPFDNSLAAFDPATVPFVHNGNGPWLYAIYDALIVEHPGGKLEMRLLESGETDDGGTTWKFTVRPDVKFSDGTALDAEAIKFNWERLAAPETKAFGAPVAQAVQSITVDDPLSFTVVLKVPNGQFLRTISTNALTFIASPTALKADPAGFNDKPVGAGAYLLDEFVPASTTTLVRNPDYYGTAYLDSIVIKPIPDETQLMNTYQSGGGDVWMTSNAVAGGQGLDMADTVGYRGPVVGGWTILFNMSKAPFDDLRLRQAFAYAMDGEALSESVYDGVVRPANNMFEEESPFYDAALDQPDASDEKAQELFDELATENGGPLEFTFDTIPSFQQQLEWLQTKLASFDNVKINVEIVPVSGYQKKWIDGDFQAAFFIIGGLDPDFFYDSFHSGQAANFSHLADKEMDAALEKGRAAQDEEARIEAYRTVQERFLELVPLKFYARNPTYIFYNPEVVHGIGDDSTYTAGFIPMWDRLWVTRD